MSPAIATSEDEHEEKSESGSLKRKSEIVQQDDDVQEQKKSDLPKKKARLPHTGSFNLVSYGSDDDDASASDASDNSDHSADASPVPGHGDDVDETADTSTLHFVVSDGGPLTVLSSEHKMSDLQAAIAAAQDSPAAAAQDDTQDEQSQQQQPQQTNGSVEGEEAAVEGEQEKKTSETELPPEPEGLCSMQLQNTVETTLRRMQHDFTFDPNRRIQDNKEFRNPR